MKHVLFTNFVATDRTHTLTHTHLHTWVRCCYVAEAWRVSERERERKRERERERER